MPTFRSLGPIIKIFRKIGVRGEEGGTHLGKKMKKVEYMKKGYLRISFANFQHSTCSIDFSGILIKFGGVRRPPCTPLTKNLKSDNAILNSLLLSTKLYQNDLSRFNISGRDSFQCATQQQK